MGGKVALTIRFSEDSQWRGSCWTNLLPLGLFAPEFYLSHESSRRHAWGWVQQLLEHRRVDPRLERMWGGHGMCAPVDYGIVMVDYVSRSFVSAQGYSWPHQISLFHFEEREGSDKLDKWRSLEAAGLLENVRSQLADQREADIRMPFEHTRCLTDQPIDSAMVEWADRTLGLSDEERALWNAWIEERGRD